MMKYVLLTYNDAALLQSLPRSELDALGAACAANDEALRASGYLLSAETVQSGDMAATVRVRHGDITIDAGPHASTREQLSGLFFIEARDLNEAFQIAARMPQARGGPIEVRPLT